MKISLINPQNNNNLSNQKPVFGMRFSAEAVKGIKISDFNAKTPTIRKIFEVLKRLKERDDSYVLADFELSRPCNIDEYPRINKAICKLEPLNVFSDEPYIYNLADFLTIRCRPMLQCQVTNTEGLTLFECNERLTFRKILNKLKFIESKKFDRHAKKVEKNSSLH